MLKEVILCLIHLQKDKKNIALLNLKYLTLLPWIIIKIFPSI